jgi:hypothetical protein
MTNNYAYSYYKKNITVDNWIVDIKKYILIFVHECNRKIFFEEESMTRSYGKIYLMLIKSKP